MSRSHVRTARATVALLVLAAVGIGVGVPSARATPRLIGWTTQADANPVDVVIDNASGLAGVHPLVEGDLPEDESDFETGPFGYGLASVFWPGATAGNAGSLAGELGLPGPLGTVAGKLNDPVRAESFVPAGPASATYPAGASSAVAEMSSHADASGVSAKAGLSDVSVPGLFDVQTVQGNTTAAAGDRATATASGSFGAVSLLAGLVQIGASSSSASASSDGVHVSGKATTHIGAITIAGQHVSVGTDGLVIGSGKGTPLSALSSAAGTAVDQVIAALGLKIVLLPQMETHQAPAEKITSGGLEISFTVPAVQTPKLNCLSLGQLSILCTLPGLLQGASVTATLGRVTATAIGTPPFGASGVGPGSNGGGTTPSASSVIPTAGVTPGGLDISPTPFGSSSPTGRITTADNPASPPRNLGSLTPVSLSTPVKVGLMVFLLVVAAAIGIALLAMSRNLDKPPLATCALEGR